MIYDLALHPNPLNLKTRRGLILRGKSLGEVAPLPGYSKETLDDCLKNLDVSFPSVRFANSSSELDLFDARDIEISPLLIDSFDFSGPATTYKIKVGHISLTDAISRLKKIKKEHPNLKLRIDANRKWTLMQALQFADNFTKSDFAYLEEPVNTFDELLAFSKKTSFPVAVDESLYDQPIDRILKLSSLRALVIKPTLFGGMEDIEACQKIIGDIPIVLSSSFESGMGLLSICKIASHLELTEPVGIDTYRFFKRDLLKKPLDLSKAKVPAKWMTSFSLL